MRPQRFRSIIWGPLVFAATAAVAFAAAPVSAAPPPQANNSWGDITSVMPGSGLSGGATEGDAILSILFGGNGAASTVARSDHDHDERFDARYAPIDHSHPVVEHNHDDRYSLLGHGHDDLYAALGHNHDESYLGLGGGTLAGLLTMTVGDLTLLGDGARVVAPMLFSTAPDGTAPLQVGSTTKVDNLNADRLDGYDASDFVLAGGSGPYALLDASNAFSGANTFNGATTFGNALNLVTGGANFTFQPFYTSSSAYTLRLVDSGRSAARLVINQDGRVGIGTTSPAFPLHVVGDIRASGINLGSGVLGPASFDMTAATDRTFAFTNSGTGAGHLSVEGTITAAGISLTNGPNASAGRAEISSGGSTHTIATGAIGASSLVFVTPDASQPGCVPAPGVLYVSARSAGASFTVAVGGATPGAGESYCFNWWVIN